MAILFAAATVMGALLASQLPKEIARWHLAAALEKRANEDLPGAIQSLDRALEWDSRNHEVYLRRAEWKRKQGDVESALADCNRALELSPDDPQAYFVRSQVYQHLGRHREAIEDWKTLEQLSREGRGFSRAAVLNGLAYARALGNTELDEGLANVEEALQLAGDNAAMLDTRGYLHYLRGDYAAALADLDAAVELIEAEWRSRLKNADPTLFDLREANLHRKQLEHSVAVIRHHRALVYDKLNQAAKAEQDRRRVIELLGDDVDERTLF